ncbi:MAG: hypothetical protein ACRDQA_17000, partial [Nocardioidaceae bacterium]
TVTTTAQDGAQEININVTGTNPDGDDVTDSTTAYYTGETGPGNGNGNGPGNGNGNGPGNGNGNGPGNGGNGNGNGNGPGGKVTIGDITVNGQPAGTAPGPGVDAGDTITISVPVKNSGSHTVTNVVAGTPAGLMDCTDKELATGESTTCSATVQASSGSQQIPVRAAAVDPSTNTTTPVVQKMAYYVGQVDNSQVGLNTGPSNDTSTTQTGWTPSNSVQPQIGGQQVAQTPRGGVAAGSRPARVAGNQWLIGVGVLMLLMALGLVEARRRQSLQAASTTDEMEIS